MFCGSRLAFVLPVLALGCGQNARGPVTIPATPDGTVRAVLDGMADQDPRVLWAALPQSYQKDITDLIHQFSTTVDAGVYDESFKLVQKVTRILREKKTFILNHPMTEGMVEKDKLAANWNSFVALFETIAKSEFSSVASLANLDVEKCLAGTGSKVFGHLMELSKMSNETFFTALGNAKVELVKTAAGMATVKVSAPGKPTEEINLRKVEGRWMPTDMVEQWADDIAEAKAGLSAMAKSKASMMQVKMALGMATAVVDQLDKAKTQKEFNDVLGGLLGGVGATPR